jgi:hypothetical protein
MKLIATLFTAARNRNNRNVHQTEERMNKTYLYNGIYLSIKPNKVLIHAHKLITLENIMLSEKSQSIKKKCKYPEKANS